MSAKRAQVSHNFCRKYEWGKGQIGGKNCSSAFVLTAFTILGRFNIFCFSGTCPTLEQTSSWSQILRIYKPCPLSTKVFFVIVSHFLWKLSSLCKILQKISKNAFCGIVAEAKQTFDHYQNCVIAAHMSTQEVTTLYSMFLLCI
jgi:hypothetical protein